MHSCVTSKNAQWPRLIWPTLYNIRPTVTDIRSRLSANKVEAVELLKKTKETKLKNLKNVKKLFPPN